MKSCLNKLAATLRKKAPTTLLALLLLAASTALASAATTWWVYAGAGTGGNGTSSKPFQTIGDATAVAQSGDTITVEVGTYYPGSYGVRVPSGVTLQGNGTQRAIVSGMYNLSPTAGTTWSTYTGTTYAPSGDVYSASVPVNSSVTKVRNLYGQYTTREPIARFPAVNTPWAVVSTYNTTTGVITLTAPLGITLATPQSAFVFVFLQGAGGYFGWYITSMSSNGSTITINPSSGSGTYYANQLVSGTRLIVCNHPQLIKNPGDWAYQDNGTSTALYWYPGSAALLDDGEFNNTEDVIYENGVSNVTISHIEVLGAYDNGIEVAGGSSGVTIQDCVLHDNGLGYSYGGDGIISRDSTNTHVNDCLIYDNEAGVDTLTDTGFVLNQSEVGYDDNDGVDIGIEASGNNTSPIVENCWLHNHTALSHADNLQFQSYIGATGNTTNATLSNSFFDIAGQDVMSQNVIGVTATNNVFMESEDRMVILGHSSSMNWALNNNTYAVAGGTATGPDTNGTAGTYTILNSVFYYAPLVYGGEQSSNYDLFGDGASYFAESEGYVHYYANPTGGEQGLPQLTASLGYEVNSSVASPPVFTNVPKAFGVVNSQLWSATTEKVTVDPYVTATGFWNVGDVVEFDADGKVRSITACTNTGTEATITFTPAIPEPVRTLAVRDWPAGTTNLVLNMLPAAGSPGTSGSSTGGPRGSTINTAQYAAGSFDGTGNRDIPAVPPDTTYGAYNQYPYNGFVP